MIARHETAVRRELQSPNCSEAIPGERTVAEIVAVCGAHRNQITKWKKQVLDELPKILSGRYEKEIQGKALTDQLYQQIGRLKVDLDWLKKKRWTCRLISGGI